MNPIPIIQTSTQLGFEFLAHTPEVVAVNRPGVTSMIGFETSAPNGILAGDALSCMYVDDRVFRLGKTNWRQLLDHAIASGHTEIYLSEEGEQGLRMPGYRFGPIARMPFLGPEYVKRAVMEKSLAAFIRAEEPAKTGRIAAGGGFKFEWAAHADGLQLQVFDGRRLADSMTLVIEELPVGCESAEKDLALQGEYLGGTLKAIDPDQAKSIGLAAAKALAAFLGPKNGLSK